MFPLFHLGILPRTNFYTEFLTKKVYFSQMERDFQKYDIESKNIYESCGVLLNVDFWLCVFDRQAKKIKYISRNNFYWIDTSDYLKHSFRLKMLEEEERSMYLVQIKSLLC